MQTEGHGRAWLVQATALEGALRGLSLFLQKGMQLMAFLQAKGEPKDEHFRAAGCTSCGGAACRMCP